ncbi:MAG: DEAD/DEAH box helicase [Lachnospiraceae bacterium]|nr:DEAD/DEAH box helicase [Lachnospiraceae bacterium]
MKVVIDYIEESNCIRISPDDFNFSQLKGLLSYIKLLKGRYINQNLIEILLEEEDVTFLYNRIKRVFEKEYSCEISSNISAQRVFDEAEEELKRFKVFSESARKIRDNEIDTNDFNDFCKRLADTTFKRNLKPYQLLSAYHLAFSQNACNFSVPGAGKTSIVLAAFEYLRKTEDLNKKVDKLVVIGPLSSFIAWKVEFEACFGYSPNCLEIRGGVNKKIIDDNLLSTRNELDLLIISYGSVSGNYDDIMFFLSHNRCMVVLDEAHRIKKVSDDAQSNYVLSLAPKAKSRVILTGTPAANSYVDLYNLYKFIWPYNNIIGYSVAQLSAMSKQEGDSRVQDLIQRISPFFIRVRKKDLNLPQPNFRRPEIVEMSDIQKEIYESIEKIVVNKYETSGLPDNIKKAAAIRLRQAASNPGLLLKAIEDDYIDFDEMTVTNLKTDDIELDKQLISKIILYKSLEIPNKFIRTLEITKELIKNNERVIIWCEFVGTCEDLSGYFADNGVNNRLLYGKINQEEREETIREFLECNSSFNVIIANPHAVGESISLHTTCHNAIYLEQGFNAGVYMQSKDRIHRVGLKDSDITNYYFIQSANSVDHVIYDRVLAKEEKMIELIESQEIPLMLNIDYEEYSDEDIKAIIKDYYERRKRFV